MSRYRPGKIKWHSYRKPSAKGVSSGAFIAGLFGIGASIVSASSKSSSISRSSGKSYGGRSCSTSHYEMSLRREERERKKEEKLRAQIQERKQLEKDVSEIKKENYSWTHIHSSINHVVTKDEILELITQCEYEHNNHVRDGLFKRDYPSEEFAKKQAKKEQDERRLQIHSLEEELKYEKERLHLLETEVWWPEPTMEDVKMILAGEAKMKIKSILPWKRKSCEELRERYVSEHLEQRYKGDHDKWIQDKRGQEERVNESLNKIQSHKKLILELRNKDNDSYEKRVEELFSVELEEWRKERDSYYNSLKQNLQNVIDGNKDYVITAVNNIFSEETLPIEFFVDFVYEKDKEKVMVDLDLPEIEDLPNKKIILTPTGKKSIRNKSQSDLQQDYANCVIGLAIYVASTIFNVSTKINHIEICGFSQRRNLDSGISKDQYIFVVDFTREIFSQIDFERLSALQVLDFFHHHCNISKSYEMKEIDLSSAFQKMEMFKPQNYEEFIMTITYLDESDEINDNEDSKVIDPSIVSRFDPIFEDAARLIVRNQLGSTSLLQRKFSIGYNRAMRLMDQLELAGIVGVAHGSKPREVLIIDEPSLEHLLSSLKR